MTTRRDPNLDALLETLGAVPDDSELLGDLALTLDAVPTPPRLRDRLMKSAVGGRFAHLAEAVARMTDLAAETARALLDGIDSPDSWTQGPVPGLDLFHIDAGPAYADAIVGFVRLPAGAPFPSHKHLGEEQVLVVQGSLEDDDGQRYRQGDVLVKAAGSSHGFCALPDVPLVYLNTIRVGVDIGGMVLMADDPRI